MKTLIVVVLTLFTYITSSFAQGSDDKVIQKLFEGLVYVGQIPSKTPPPIVPSHAVGVASLPVKFVPGVQYVFHIKRDRPEFSYVELRKRIEALSLKEISGPRRPTDLLHLYIGAPLYRFELQQSKRRLLVYNNNCDWLIGKGIESNTEALNIMALYYFEDVILEVK